MTLVYIILAIIVIAVLVLAYIFFIKPVKGLSSMERLQGKPGPTAKYLDNMADTETIFGWANDLVEMGRRMPGTPEGLKAQNYVKEKLENFGLDEVEIVPSETNLWNYSDWSLKVAGEDIPCYFITHTLNLGESGVFTADNIAADIVYVGKGQEKDIKGLDLTDKIVLADVDFSSVPIALSKAVSHFFYDPDKKIKFGDAVVNPYSACTFPYNYFNAMAGGAVGFIGILTDYIDSNEYNNEDYTYLGSDMKLPGLWVTKKDGEKLKSMIASGKKDAVMNLTAEIRRVQAGAVVGILKGKSDEALIVQTHYDSSTPGGTEDASGTAVVLAMAEFFAKMDKNDIEKTLLFTFMDTHFTDYDSHDSFKAKFMKEGHKILADISIEHLALIAEERDGKLIPTEELEPRIIFIDKLDELIKITKEELVRHRYGKIVMLPTSFFDAPPTDAEQLWEDGISMLSLISGPIYLYDNQDTADMIAKDELRPTAETFSDILWRASRLPAASLKR